MKKAKYIVLEGTEGVGKTTQTQVLVDTLVSKGFKVLQTKEPGTNLAPLTVTLRGIMLDQQYDNQLTKPSRELISQAIRSIHLEHVIIPALSTYDYIIQDRGILSGFAYGVACGNEFKWIETLVKSIMPPEITYQNLYDKIIYLKGDVSKGLDTALASKKEFAAGDAIELKGLDFMKQVQYNMGLYSYLFGCCDKVSVDGLGIEEVAQDILEIVDDLR